MTIPEDLACDWHGSDAVVELLDQGRPLYICVECSANAFSDPPDVFVMRYEDSDTLEADRAQTAINKWINRETQ